MMQAGCDATRGRCAMRYASSFLLAAALAIGGCGDETQAPSSSRSAAGDVAPHKVQWLEVSSAISPAQWLASRGEERLKPSGDPQVQHVAQQLKAAHGLYRESERMIANRSVQVSDMLQQIGITERPTDVLDDLAKIGGEVGQTEGYGAISQYYFNLRAARVARAEALATLKTRYGPRS